MSLNQSSIGSNSRGFAWRRPRLQMPLIVASLVTTATLLIPCIVQDSVAFGAPSGTKTKSQTNNLPAQSSRIATSNEYRLGPEDILEVTVSNHPDLASTPTVQPDGKVSIPRAGDIYARGKTALQLAREIERRLSASLNNAHVQVAIKQARPRQARIIGAVATAGTYTIKQNARLMDLVAMAGGLNTKSNRVSGRVIRAGKVIPFDLPKAVNDPASGANTFILPDDLVVLDAVDYVRQITVMGQVTRPGAYDLEEGLTPMSLLAQAGGALPSAALKKTHILREGRPVLTDLSAISTGNISPDSPIARFQFKPGDVLVVPENAARFGVMGQVAKPSYYALPENGREATVLKALAMAGGALVDGDLSQISITRTSQGRTQIIPVNATLMMSGKAPDNVVLESDDVLLVPKIKERQVSVIGQVTRPGSYPLDDDVTLLSLLAQAGNPTNGAGLSRAYVLRDGVQMPVNLRAAVVERRPEKSILDFTLLPNDVLVIPDTADQIQVIGQVAKPGAYSLDDDLTIMSLLAKAGNTTDIAALGRTYILRNGQRIEFDLRSTVAGNVDEAVLKFNFEPGDVLVVPENQLRFAVMGQVAKPGYYPFPENASEATILKALSEAGGPASTGTRPNLAQSGIIRTVNGNPQVIPVNLSNTLTKGEFSNMQLQPGDVLYIPPKKPGFSWANVLGPIAALGSLGFGF